MKWFLSNKLGTMKCTGSKEGDPVGILGYLNLPLEGADIPYQIIVFADGTKPSSSMLKVSLDKLGLVEMFREWKASIGVDRDDQWNSEISLYGVRPFDCSWPDDNNGCVQKEAPRGFLKLKIGEIKFDKIIDKGALSQRSTSHISPCLVPRLPTLKVSGPGAPSAAPVMPFKRRANADNKFLNFRLVDTTFTMARSPDGVEGWGEYDLLEEAEEWEHFGKFCADADRRQLTDNHTLEGDIRDVHGRKLDFTEDEECDYEEEAYGEVGDQPMVSDELQYASMDGFYLSTKFKFQNKIVKKILCLTAVIMGMDCPTDPQARAHASPYPSHAVHPHHLAFVARANSPLADTSRRPSTSTWRTRAQSPGPTRQRPRARPPKLPTTRGRCSSCPGFSPPTAPTAGRLRASAKARSPSRASGP